MTVSSQINEQALSWFVSLREPDSTEDAWLAFQDWLEADEAHRRAYDRIEQTWLDCDEPDSAPETANDAPRDIPRGRQRASGTRPWLLPAMGMAAAVVLAFGLFGQTAPLQTFHTDGQSRVVVLEDGSRITMNRHTDLSVRMESGGRRVALTDGEAAFDVAHDADRPFVIAAGNHSVRVLGTAFNVLSHGGRFAVGVERGVVAVTPGPDQTPVRLIAGQELNQISDGAPVLSQVDPKETAAWRQGVLVYRDSSMTDVAFDLSRYLDKTVNVSPAARSLRFTGALRVSDEVTMLRQIQDFAPVQVTRSGTGIDLVPRDDR
ncbi:MAG: DUF4880 domain-containing protein [Brevundimonas sp.]|nr:MAG: DUF4880 domain-containing protein [Brevundimonas sp.]